jgi:hypothetical protein
VFAAQIRQPFPAPNIDKGLGKYCRQARLLDSWSGCSRRLATHGHLCGVYPTRRFLTRLPLLRLPRSGNPRRTTNSLATNRTQVKTQPLLLCLPNLRLSSFPQRPPLLSLSLSHPISLVSFCFNQHFILTSERSTGFIHRSLESLFTPQIIISPCRRLGAVINILISVFQVRKCRMQYFFLLFSPREETNGYAF